MGEYATIRGVYLKLGTGDDWRYVRREECERWLSGATEGESAIRRGLEDPATIYRFPFPSEDGSTVAHVIGRNMGKPDVVLAMPFPADDRDHKPIWVSVNHGGAYNVNVQVPCPYILPVSYRIGEHQLKHSAGPSQFYAQVYGERYGEASPEGRTIFACIYCEALFALTEEDVTHLVDGRSVEIIERVKGVRNGG